MCAGFVRVGSKVNLNGYLVQFNNLTIIIIEISGEKKCGPAFIHFDYANFNS